VLTRATLTGNPVYDACGSIAVGSLLGVIAAWLIQTNRRALVGRPLGRSQLDKLLCALRADAVVAEVLDAKSEEIGPGVFRFKAEIEFKGDAIVARYLASPGQRDRLVAMFAAAGVTSDGRAMDAALAEYGRGLVTAVGDEVDRLEGTIMALEPSIRHVDIETN
jgi:zinc transporter 9